MKENSILLTFIKCIDVDLVENLYNNPYACFAIYRELSSLCRHIILRLLNIEETVRISLISSWVNKEKSNLFKKCLDDLTQLRIFITVQDESRGDNVRLNRKFQENLKFSMFGGKIINNVVKIEEETNLNQKSLMLNSMQKIENILTIVAEGRVYDDHSIISKIITHANYLKNGEITNYGFYFLLLDERDQLWEILHSYLKYMKHNSNIIDVLHVIFQIGFELPNQTYSFKNPTKAQTLTMNHFVKLGFLNKFVYDDKQLIGYFQPSELFTNLIYGYDRRSETILDHRGYIMMAENDHLYAITNSKLQIGILKMFCNQIFASDQESVYTMTFKTIYNAIDKGVTGDQIISFLRSHGHPNMKKKNYVPNSLVDLIRETERTYNNSKTTMIVMYEAETVSDFKLIENYATSIGALGWKDVKTLRLAITTTGHPLIKKFWKQRK